MKVLKKIIVIFLLAFLFTACDKNNKKNYVIHVGCIWSETHPMVAAAKNVFKTTVEKETNGRVLVNIKDSTTIGLEEDALWDNVRKGKIEAAILGSSMNNEWQPILVLNWPFLYRDLQHARNVWTSSSFTNDMNKQFHENFSDAYVLAWGPNSARTFTSNKKLTNVDDFAGQTFRVPDNPIHIGIVESLGAVAEKIKIDNLYESLKEKIVDGQENGMVTVISEHLDDVQKYLLETDHIISTLEIIINADFFDDLPYNYQTIVSDAAKESALAAWNNYIESIDKDREYLKSKGLTITICATDDLALFNSKVEKFTDELMLDNLSWAPALLGKIRAIQ
ncbi:MAG: TRAP transporter substrate-binding protein [Termitinemataceae bacterium]|nr:MAG: TRAP transporter substrate-binding protein [Termitinemataceae bacterium]